MKLIEPIIRIYKIFIYINSQFYTSQ
ncbi:hypothetical protein MPL1032_130348 [Mesorhizobium plurifarium]|uniref:Uncharacterized protein n=1 Tax=Mesorhizobium plurifarium TaxID=69974 RepID=A0A0K2VRP9_MESPL|nr:hypothetical protein MPL1032_130348 [Mesorhizobium plurifarium]